MTRGLTLVGGAPESNRGSRAEKTRGPGPGFVACAGSARSAAGHAGPPARNTASRHHRARAHTLDPQKPRAGERASRVGLPPVREGKQLRAKPATQESCGRAEARREAARRAASSPDAAQRERPRLRARGRRPGNARRPV